MIPSIRRALPRGAAAIAALGLLAAGCSGGDDPTQAGSAGPPDQVTYLTAFGLFGREGYVHVADAKGFFAEQGIEITIEPGAPGNEESVSAGQAEFASTDSSAAFQRYEAGVDGFQIISAVQQEPLTAVITTESTGIKRAADLEGKTIGGAENGIGAQLLPAYLDQAGGPDPTSVKIEPVDGAQLPTALASGQVDGVFLFTVGRPAIEAATGEPAVVLRYDEVLFDLYGAVHIANADLVEENPDLVRRFNTAIMQGLEYAVENPAEAGEILTEYVPETNPEVAAGELEILAGYVRAGLPNDRPTGIIVQPKLTRAVTLLQGAGLIDGIKGRHGRDLLNMITAWELVPGADEFDLTREE